MKTTTDFYRATRYAYRGLCCRPVSVCLSVILSVCHVGVPLTHWCTASYFGTLKLDVKTPFNIRMKKRFISVTMRSILATQLTTFYRENESHAFDLH